MQKVLIFHGTGRSGTSMLNIIMVNHPELAWLSNYQWKLMGLPFISVLNRWVNFSVDLNDPSRSKWQVHACNEPYDLWRKFYPDINNKDGQPKGEPYDMDKYLAKLSWYAGKKMFATKITGQSRAAFLEHAFKNYEVIWIDRDPRAVVLSMMKQRWLYRKKPEEYDAMTFREKVKKYVQLYSTAYNSKFDIPQSKRLDVKYEDLVAQPEQFFRNLCEKCGLRYSSTFADTVRQWKIQPISSEQYKSALNQEDWELLNISIEEVSKQHYQ